LQNSYYNLLHKLENKASKQGDIPVGALIVDSQGKIIGKGYNQKNKQNNPIKHAELIAIKQACKIRND
jgi:tRNA(adenine34) deaminase